MEVRGQASRVLRALKMRGRSLVRTGDHWSIVSRGDRRRRARLPLGHADVGTLARAGLIIAAGADRYVLVGACEVPPPLDPQVMGGGSRDCRDRPRA